MHLKIDSPHTALSIGLLLLIFRNGKRPLARGGVNQVKNKAIVYEFNIDEACDNGKKKLCDFGGLQEILDNLL